MIYCFDTSALNRLFDDSERDSIVHGLLDTGSFYISAYNVIEVAKIPDETRRTALVQLMKRLADNKRPLDRPNTIVLSHATAHAAGKSRATVNADSNLEGLWIALNQPELIDDDARHEVVAWTKEVEGDFSKVVAGDRDMFQKFFQDVPTERPLNASFTLRTYLNQTSECRSLISDVYHRHTGTALTDSGYDKLVHEPAWPLYFLGYAYAIHYRAIQEYRFQERRNAGAMDLGQAVYLPLCDRFITHDGAQCRALRLLNAFNIKKPTQVLMYDLFRKRLFPLG